jgi:hypothetical protein
MHGAACPAHLLSLALFCHCCAAQAKQQQLIQEKRKQEEEKLLAALATPMGFHKGKPLAALVVFRSCLQWRAFQADRTSVFDRIIQVRCGKRHAGDEQEEFLASHCLPHFLHLACSARSISKRLQLALCVLAVHGVSRHAFFDAASGGLAVWKGRFVVMLFVCHPSAISVLD